MEITPTGDDASLDAGGQALDASDADDARDAAEPVPPDGGDDVATDAASSDAGEAASIADAGPEDAGDVDATDAGSSESDAGDASPGEPDAGDASDASDASDPNDASEEGDAADAADDCSPDSGPTTCGLNGRGTTSAVCVDASWAVTCADPDECFDNTSVHAPCGVNRRGTSTRTCAAGHWGPPTCVDPDECQDGAQQNGTCGVNGRGTSTRTCAAGHWGPSTCVDPDDCLDGLRDVHAASCGLNGRGTSTRVCATGHWGTTTCDDPDQCKDGATSAQSCGDDASGTAQLSCVQGRWSASACECPTGEVFACSGRCVPNPSRSYVNLAVVSCQDGLSWGTAFTSPAPALAHVADGGEVWIAAGVYSTSVSVPSFVVDHAMTIYGGFAGTEVALAGRDPSRHPVTFRRGLDLPATPATGHSIVVTTGAFDAGIDGLAIEDGASPSGGGLVIDQTHVALRNVSFARNQAQYGGAILLSASAGPEALTLDGCTFDSNHADEIGGAVDGPAVVRGSTFTGNTSKIGGALCNPTSVTDSVFEQNQATDSGGA
ncbi:MAG TPA: hypothetical protein VGI39_30850, partial [Polyangiaceae bacterium]